MKSILLTISLALVVFSLKAQTTSSILVSSSSESFKNSSYQLDWSIGELQTETFIVIGQSLAQGFHQYDYSVATALEQRPEFKYEITAYPNPTADMVSLKCISPVFENMLYTITEINGKVLQTGRMVENNQQISFLNFPAGTYFITIQQNKIVVKSFKIIKK